MGLQPVLRPIRPRHAGAADTAEDESGEANQSLPARVKRCTEYGVNVLLSHTVTALREFRAKIDHVQATEPEGRFLRLRADACASH